MCDSTGHDGFSSLDDALVLWGGGNPCASCRVEKREKVTEEITAHKMIFPRRKEEEKTRQTNFRKTHFSWNDVLLFCILFSWWFFSQKTPRWWLQTRTQHCFCVWRNWFSFFFIVILHNIISQPLWRIARTFTTHVKTGVFLKKNVSVLSVWNCALTPDHEVSRRLVDAPGVARHAGVGPGVGDVRGGDEQAARLQQGEPRQLDRTARQHALT